MLNVPLIENYLKAIITSNPNSATYIGPAPGCSLTAPCQSCCFTLQWKVRRYKECIMCSYVLYTYFINWHCGAIHASEKNSNHLWRIRRHRRALVQTNRVGRDERVCQGPGESTLMEMTVLERDSRRVMAPIQPPLCSSPVQTGCPPEPRLAQLNTALLRKLCICPGVITQWKSITLKKYQWWKSLNWLSPCSISN